MTPEDLSKRLNEMMRDPSEHDKELATALGLHDPSGDLTNAVAQILTSVHVAFENGIFTPYVCELAPNGRMETHLITQLDDQALKEILRWIECRRTTRPAIFMVTPGTTVSVTAQDATTVEGLLLRIFFPKRTVVFVAEIGQGAFGLGEFAKGHDSKDTSQLLVQTTTETLQKALGAAARTDLPPTGGIPGRN